jgi:general nucleoside transport system permease protein
MPAVMRRLYRVVAALLIPTASLATALLAVAGLVLIIGENPGRALLTLLRGALGDLEGIGYTLFYATDYVFAGLAVALPFQAGLFNIGGEGQAALGDLGATLVVLAIGDLPAPLVLALPVAVVAAAGFGAAWAFVPALLQARRGSHLVITTIMFNFIATALMTWFLVEVLIAPGQSALESRTFPSALWLPTLTDLTAGTRFDAGGAPLNPPHSWRSLRRRVTGCCCAAPRSATRSAPPASIRWRRGQPASGCHELSCSLCAAVAPLPD